MERTITLTVPDEVYEQALSAAKSKRRSIEAHMSAVLEEAITSDQSARALLQKVSRSYKRRLARQGKLDQSDSEVLQELEAQRERIARAIYS